MTTQASGYSYTTWRISKPITDDEYNAMRTASVDPASATISGDVVTLAQQDITTYDIKDDVQSWQPDPSYGTRPAHNINSGAQAVVQGRQKWEATGRFYVNTNTDRTNDLLFKDSSGVRLLYIVDTGGVFVQLAIISRTSTEENSPEGDSIRSVRFEGAARWIAEPS